MSLVRDVFAWPFRKLYLEGPAVLGFWESLSRPDICAHITGVNAEFWQEHPLECYERVDNRMQAWEVFVAVGLAYFVLMALLCMLGSRFLLVNPIMHEFRYIREKICGPTKKTTCESPKNSPSG